MQSETTKTEAEPIRLRAVDSEDLTVIGSLLQDAVANVSEMAFLPAERRFVLAVCRLRWEQAFASDDEEPFRRISCVISVENVVQPRYRGFSLKDRGQLMPILAMSFAEGALVITFGGGAAVRLEVEALDLRVEDYGTCWPTAFVPEHGNLEP